MYPGGASIGVAMKAHVARVVCHLPVRDPSHIAWRSEARVGMRRGTKDMRGTTTTAGDAFVCSCVRQWLTCRRWVPCWGCSELLGAGSVGLLQRHEIPQKHPWIHGAGR